MNEKGYIHAGNRKYLIEKIISTYNVYFIIIKDTSLSRMYVNTAIPLGTGQ